MDMIELNIPTNLWLGQNIPSIVSLEASKGLGIQQGTSVKVAGSNFPLNQNLPYYVDNSGMDPAQREEVGV